MLGADIKSLSGCFRAGKQLELLEQLKRLEQAPLVERLEPLELTFLGVFKAMEGLSPQVKQKFFATIREDCTGFEAS